MRILGITTPVLRTGDDLASILQKSADMQSGDILVISSKAIATTEGAAIDLRTIEPKAEAMTLAKTVHQDPLFTQAILNESKRMHGQVAGTCPFAILTSLKPGGLKKGRILCPNAGLDQSNIEKGYAIGWPQDPIQSIKKLKESFSISCHAKLPQERSGVHFPFSIIVSDSCCRPSRLGVTAFALVCCGIEPFRSDIGKVDLFGKKLHVTQEAVADQLATAANAVMGNAGQSTPAAIIRDHGIPFSDFCGWVEGMEPEEDMFGGFFR